MFLSQASSRSKKTQMRERKKTAFQELISICLRIIFPLLSANFCHHTSSEDKNKETSLAQLRLEAPCSMCDISWRLLIDVFPDYLSVHPKSPQRAVILTVDGWISFNYHILSEMFLCCNSGEISAAGKDADRQTEGQKGRQRQRSAVRLCSAPLCLVRQSGGTWWCFSARKCLFLPTYLS